MSRFAHASRSYTHLASCAVLLLGVAACQRDEPQGRQAIAGAGGAASTPTNAPANAAAANAPVVSEAKLPLAAMTALDAGNNAYRAKKLDVALAKYREAAAAAPQHAAPWFGIYMAANEMQNKALADSALAHVRGLAADPAALDAHATITSADQGVGSASPSGHPSAASALPPGHPSRKTVGPDSTKRRRM